VVLALGVAACGQDRDVTLDSGKPAALPGASRDTSCDDDGSPTIDGNDRQVVVTGECDAVTVKGIGNHVTIESVGKLTVTGADNHVEVTEHADRLNVRGAGHDITVPEGTKVDDRSLASTINGATDDGPGNGTRGNKGKGRGNGGNDQGD
jgi:hypothetical protein